MAKIIDGVAFITEAGSGFGQSAAYSLAQHGVREFALVDSNEAGLQETAATLSSRHGVTEVLVLPTASGDEKAAEAAVQDAAARFGRIDFAINNAGFGGPMSGSPDTAPAAFEQHLAQNVTGPWLWQRAQIRQMLRQPVRDNNPRYGRGSIVHVCSVHAFAASPPQFAAGAYVAGRHAVLGLTRSEGVLYAPQGIRINALCPGYTASPLIESSEQLKKTISDLVRERVPVGRLAAPEEVADAVVFLASPMSSYMYGQALVLDGGYLAQ